MSPTPFDLPPSDLVRRWMEQWEQSPPADLDEFLRRAGEVHPDQLAALVRIDQTQRCRRGQWVPIDDYFRRFPDLRSDSENALLLIYGEYLLRQQQGESPSVEEYAQRFPTLADALSVQLQLHQALESAGMTSPQQTPTTEKLSATAGPATLPHIPDFEVIGELGRGGMGVVYKARQTSLKRIVALKMIRVGEGPGSEVLERFREAELLGRLQHPNIVQVYEIGDHDGRAYLVLEYVEGGSLAGRLLGSPLPPREAAALVRTLAEAAEAAHQRGVVHRDLKPANVLLAACGVATLATPQAAIPKITDFGLARQVDADSQQTQSGVILGTPSYMAPEQARGEKDLGPAVDIYALGAILYECLTGRPPFRGASSLDTLEFVRGADPVPPRRLQPKVPRDLETICLKCLRKERTQRYASAQAFADDLRRFLDGRPIMARPIGAMRRAAKWVRRRPLVAALLFVIGTLIASLVGLLAWEVDRAERRRIDAEADADQMRQLRDDEAYQRLQTQRLAVDAMTDQGVRRCQSGDAVHGTLLLTRALELTAPQATDQQRSLRRLLTAWGSEFLPLRLILPHEQAVVRVAFSRDGRQLITATKREVRLWDAHSGAPVSPPYPIPHPDGGVVLALSSDGRTVLLGETGMSSSFQLWDFVHGERIGPPLPHPNALPVGDFSADGRVAVTGDGWVDRGETRLWDAATGQPLGAPLVHRARLSSVSLAPDGRTLLTASTEVLTQGDQKNIKVRLWDGTKGDLRHEWPRDGQQYTDLAAFSGDGKRLVIVMNSQAQLWDAASYQSAGPRWRVGLVSTLALSPDGGRLLTISTIDGTARLWDTATGEPLGAPLRCLQPIRTAAFSPDSETLLTGSEDGTARLWGVTRPPSQYALPKAGYVSAVSFRPDSATFLTASGDKTIRLWGLADTDRVETTHLLSEPVKGIPPLVWGFSPDGRTIATGGFRFPPQLWSLSTGKPLSEPLNVQNLPIAFMVDATGKHLPVAGTEATALTFSPDSKRVLAGSGSAWLFDVATGRRLTPEMPHGFRINTVAISPDGSRLVTAGQEMTARIWDAATGKQVGQAMTHRGEILAAIFSADGKLVLTASRDRTARLWDAQTGEPRSEPLPHDNEVFAVAFSPDGRLALTGTKDKIARFWDVAKGKPIGAPLVHPSVIARIAFRSDGAVALTAGADGTTQLWDVASSQALGPVLMAPPSPPSGLPIPDPQSAPPAVFSPDGRLLLVGGAAPRLERVPEPLTDDPVRLRLQLEIGTGKWLDEGGGAHDLDREGLLERWRRLQQMSP